MTACHPGAGRGDQPFIPRSCISSPHPALRRIPLAAAAARPYSSSPTGHAGLNRRKNMTTTQAPHLLSTGARLATALAVMACVAAAWLGTRHESHRAVQTAATAITGPTYVTLQPVEIVARRVRTDAVAAL
jgi:hypothetical protein